VIPSAGSHLPVLVERGKSQLVRPARRPHRILHPAVPVLDGARYGLRPHRIHLGAADAPGPLGGRYWISAMRQQSVMAIGGTASGKSRSLIVPNVLGWPGPVVVATTKPDVFRWCHAARSHRGQVWVFDPRGDAGPLPPGVRRLAWSHLRGAANLDVAIARAEQLGARCTGAGMENGNFWASAGRRLMAALVHAAALQGCSISVLDGWVARGALDEAIAILARHGEIALSRTLRSTQADERHLGNVMHQVRLIMAPYRSAAVRAQADEAVRCRFDAREFLHRPNTLFVVSPSDKETDLSSLVVGLVEEVRAAALWLSDRSPTMAVPIPLLLALDETANIAPLPSLDRIVFESRSRDISVICCFQTYGQAEQLFGGLADGFIFHGGCSLFLGAQGDDAVVRRLHQLGGVEHVRQTTVSESRSTEGLTGRLRPWDTVRSRTTTHGWQQVPRFPEDRISSLPRGRAFCLLRGHLGVIDVPDFESVDPYASWSRLRPLVDVVPSTAPTRSEEVSHGTA
jgi:type IV secretion system protein VirD4